MIHAYSFTKRIGINFVLIMVSLNFNEYSLYNQFNPFRARVYFLDMLNNATPYLGFPFVKCQAEFD